MSDRLFPWLVIALILSVFIAGICEGHYLWRVPDQTALIDLTTQNLFDCRAALYRKK